MTTTFSGMTPSSMVDRRKLSFALLVLTTAILLYEYSAIEHEFGNYKQLKGHKHGLQDIISRSYTTNTSTHNSSRGVAERVAGLPRPFHNGSIQDLIESLNISLDTFLSDDYNFTEDVWLSLMEARQSLRVGRMNYHCDKYKIAKMSTDSILRKKPIRHALYANDQYKLLFGLVLKVASNHFKKAMAQLGGSRRLYLMPDEQCRGRIGKYYRAIFVRHPLARTLSAYKDKFIEHHIPHFIQIGRRIIGTVREGAGPAEIKRGLGVTFPELIQYLTRGAKARSNAHWDHIWLHNRVCELRYDFIGRIETIADDYRYLIHKISRGKRDTTENEFLKAYRSYHGDNQKLRAYYSNVSRTSLKRWYEIYSRDFLIFGYDMNILGTEIWPS